MRRHKHLLEVYYKGKLVIVANTEVTIQKTEEKTVITIPETPVPQVIKGTGYYTPMDIPPPY